MMNVIALTLFSAAARRASLIKIVQFRTEILHHLFSPHFHRSRYFTVFNRKIAMQNPESLDLLKRRELPVDPRNNALHFRDHLRCFMQWHARARGAWNHLGEIGRAHV